MNILRQFTQQHPIIRIGIAAMMIKILTLAQYYLTDDAIGDSVNSLLFSILYHFFLSGSIFLILMSLRQLLKSGDVIFKLVAFIYAGFTVLLCQIDLIMVKLTGMRFTPSIIRTYGFEYLYHQDVVKAIKGNPIFLVLVGGLILLIVIGAVLYKYVAKWKKPLNYSLVRLAVPALFLAIGWFFILKYKSDYFLQTRPSDVAFLDFDYYGGKSSKGNQVTPERGNELLALYNDLEIDTNEEFPLFQYHQSKDSVKRRPDVIFLMIESLRGQELEIGHSKNPAFTPNIDSLARNGVVFPKFVSNGYPTDDGMFATHTSVIPHSIKKNIRDHFETTYTAIPNIMRDQGYYNLGNWSGRPSFYMGKWFEKWYGEFHYQCDSVEGYSTFGEGGDCGDSEFFKHSADQIRAYDESENDQPLFFYLQNNDTHYPFRPDKNRFGSESQLEEYNEFTKNHKKLGPLYRETLEWTDLKLKQFLDFLKTRENADNTIIIMVGDHAKEADEVFKAGTRFYPMNAFVLTTAIISGPESYIGKPRIESFPTSQVDVLPSIISMLDFDTKYASWGRSMLDPAMNRYSISVRPGGIRYNWKDSSIYINSNNPNDYWANKFYDESNERNDFRSESLKRKAKEVFELVHYGSYLTESDHLTPEK